ncbi:D-alanyl-D-alanine carboxypeptidase [Rhizobium sp. L1K21]|nr:D-alanyl-D-alanine carboxypeptidase [Rhizobium sp. L1K21]
MAVFVTVAAVASICLSVPAQAAQYAGIVIDVNSGKVLYSSSADSKRYPASLTKMMTLYLVFEALEQGRIKKSSKVTMSSHAAGEPPSKLGVKAGRSITVEQAILSLVTRSANDVATALGEFLAGSEAKFGRMMTAKAKSLGMTHTAYYNAHGLPDSRQVTTARDQAILSIALRQHFPQYYDYFSTRSFRFGNQNIGNHNRLLGRVRGVDGIKTGYTRAAGFNLATSVKVDGRSLVVVVLGMPSGASRNAKVTELVQKYLPKSSTRSSGMTIAKLSSGTFNLPDEVPLPTARYEEPASTPVMAYADEGTDSLEHDDVPLPLPAPAFVPGEASAQTAVNVDTVTTGSTQKDLPSGWVIQVGAAETPRDAQALLESVQSKGGNVLRTVSPFTMAYNDQGNELYRARFGGFKGQKDAVNACKQLKRKGIGCWASMQ